MDILLPSETVMKGCSKFLINNDVYVFCDPQFEREFVIQNFN